MEGGFESFIMLQRILMIKSYFVLNSLSRQFCLNVTQPTELSRSGKFINMLNTWRKHLLE